MEKLRLIQQNIGAVNVFVIGMYLLNFALAGYTVYSGQYLYAFVSFVHGMMFLSVQRIIQAYIDVTNDIAGNLEALGEMTMGPDNG